MRRFRVLVLFEKIVAVLVCLFIMENSLLIDSNFA